MRVDEQALETALVDLVHIDALADVLLARVYEACDGAESEQAAALVAGIQSLSKDVIELLDAIKRPAVYD